MGGESEVSEGGGSDTREGQRTHGGTIFLNEFCGEGKKSLSQSGDLRERGEWPIYPLWERCRKKTSGGGKEDPFGLQLPLGKIMVQPRHCGRKL